MTEYNIEVEIDVDRGTITAQSQDGVVYAYDIYSHEGATLLSRILEGNVKTTVYSQDETFEDVESYNEYLDEYEEEEQEEDD